MKTLISFLFTTMLIVTTTAQQSEIEHNSSNISPHVLLHEKNSTEWARLWFTNNATSNKWAINAKTLPTSKDNSPIDPLDVPMVFAYDGEQILGLSNTGRLRINKAYTLPSADGAMGKVLQTDGNGNVSWQTISGTGGSSDKIEDADLDTYIHTDKNTDDDKIYMNFADTINGSTERIVLGNNGYGVFNFEIKDENKNVFIGESAGVNTGNGSSLAYHASKNTAIGYEALKRNTTGDSNIAVGYRSLEHNSTGRRNSAFGSFALWNLSTGDDNVAIGYDAGAHNIDVSSKNTYIGNGAGRLSTTSQGVKNENVAIGHNAGSTSEGDQNVFIGESAGFNTDGTGNVFIGHDAGINTDGTGNVFIGHDAGSNLGGASNTLIISNEFTPLPLIYGEFDDGINSPSLQVNGLLKITDVLELPPKTSLAIPACSEEGQIYLHKDSAATPIYKLQVCDGTNWVDF